MAIPNVPTRVMAIIDPGLTHEQIATALSNQSEFQLVEVLDHIDKLTRDVRSVNPQIILVDHQVGGTPTLDIIDDLALQFPEAAVVAILPNNDPQKAQQVMLAGARGFIVQPFTQVNLLSTLRRVHELETRRAGSRAGETGAKAEEERGLRTLAVYSPRGGAGTSTTAVNLAVALHESTLDEVLLLEGKLLFGHLGVMLNIRTQNSIAELIPHASNLDPSLVKDVVTDHTSGIHVLLAPVNVQAGQGIRAEALYNLVTALQKMYDYLIIDAGSALNENSVTLMDLADRILLVSTPDLAALHDISRFIQLSSTLAYPPGKLAVVLNRQGMQGGVKTKDIETALHHELFAQIQEDEANALRSLNRGIPLVLNYPRSPASQGFRALAKSLAAVNVAAQAKQASPRAKPTSKRTQTATKPVSKATASQGTASKGTSSQRTASN